MTKWRNPEPPDWSHFFPKLRQLWHNPKWSGSIYVDDASGGSPPQGAPSAGHLHSHLQRIAARACSVCDPHAHRPFPSTVALSKHVATQHHRHMCGICLNVGAGHLLALPPPSTVQCCLVIGNYAPYKLHKCRPNSRLTHMCHAVCY